MYFLLPIRKVVVTGPPRVTWDKLILTVAAELFKLDSEAPEIPTQPAGTLLFQSAGGGVAFSYGYVARNSIAQIGNHGNFTSDGDRRRKSIPHVDRL